MEGMKILSVERKECNWVEVRVEISAERFEKQYESAVKYHPCKKLEEGGEEHLLNMAAGRLLDESVPEVLKETGIQPMIQLVVNPEQTERNKPFIYSFKVIDRPEVKLGQYKGIKVSYDDITVTDDETDMIFDQLLRGQMVVKKLDRPAQMGDEAVIDFEGFVDGEAFSGGKAQYYSLVLGSHSFIAGFEEQIAGHSEGDEFDVNVTFPESYRSTELAGKAAVFKCKLQRVHERPQIEHTDEFIKKYTRFGSMDEFRTFVREFIFEQKKQEFDMNKQNIAIAKAVDNAEVVINDEIIEAETDNLLRRFENELAQNGMKLEQYCEKTGITVQKIRDDLRPQAVMHVKNDLVLGKIAEIENITITEKDIEEFVQSMSKAYNIPPEQARTLINDSVKKGLAADEAGKLIFEAAIYE